MKIKQTIVATMVAVALGACSQKSPSTPAATDSNYSAGSNLTIEYKNDYPTQQTVDQMREELVYQSAVQVALWAMPLVSLGKAMEGMNEAGIGNTTISIAENRASSDNVIYTANQETVYAYGFTVIGDEPMVFTIAPMTLGFIADAWQRPIEDVGLVGPDAGKGGKYIVLPPGYTGEMPKEDRENNVYVYQSPTKTVFWLQRAFLTADQDESEATTVLQEKSEIYPLSQENRKRDQQFMNQTITPYNAVLDFEGMEFWNVLNKMIQLEPVAERDLSMMGLAKTIGIQKGKEFNPTDAQKKVLLKAQETAQAMMVSLGYGAGRNGTVVYDGRQWEIVFQTQSPYFDGDGHLEVHERATFMHQAMTGAKGMVTKMVGKGSQYQLTAKDSGGNFFNGSNSYTLNIPKNVPINNYWSICLYDIETRSLIANGTPKSCSASISDLDQNSDGSYDLYFGTEKPEGVNDNNFVLTKDGEGWFTYMRYYGPEEAFFDKTWVPNDFEKISE
ncbi:MAG: DUF1254 domain-containing protein [Nitrospirota bacterium]|nr:DUF1254 domain-containing protein [Nitrospirota bacterium]